VTIQTTHLKSSEDKVGVQRQPDGPLYAPGRLSVIGSSLLCVNLERLEQVPNVFVLSSIKVGDLFTLAFLSAEKTQPGHGHEHAWFDQGVIGLDLLSDLAEFTLGNDLTPEKQRIRFGRVVRVDLSEVHVFLSFHSS